MILFLLLVIIGIVVFGGFHIWDLRIDLTYQTESNKLHKDAYEQVQGMLNRSFERETEWQNLCNRYEDQLRMKDEALEVANSFILKGKDHALSV